MLRPNCSAQLPDTLQHSAPQQHRSSLTVPSPTHPTHVRQRDTTAQSQLIQQHAVLAFIHLLGTPQVVPRPGAGPCSTSLQVLLGLRPGQVRELHVAGAYHGAGQERGAHNGFTEKEGARAAATAVSTGHRRGDSGWGRRRGCSSITTLPRPRSTDRAREQVVLSCSEGRTEAQQWRRVARARSRMCKVGSRWARSYAAIPVAAHVAASVVGLSRRHGIPSALAIHRRSLGWPTG